MSKRLTSRSKEEVLNSPVNLSGAGEDQVIKDLLSDKFVKGTNQEASEIAIALRQLISGQDLLLQNQSKQSEEMAKIRQRMAEMDAAAEKWETDRAGFLLEVEAKAEKLRTIDPERAIAKGAIEFQNALVQAKAEFETDKLQFKQRLANMPKETVVSPGELITVMEQGRQVSKIIPEEVRIKNVVWYLKPGVPTEVPTIVGDLIRDRRRSQEETRSREDMLSRNLEQPAFDKEWANINQKFHSPAG